MRRLALSLVLVAAAALPAAAQMPPSITKPIEAAKKAAGNMSKQINAANKVGAQADAPLPAAAAQAAQGGTGMKTAPNTKAAPAPQGAAASAATKAATDSAQKRGSANQAATKGTVTFYREEYTYSDEGRRDPFVSLMATGELRPLLADLVVTGVLYDYAAPNRSLAVLVDGTTQETYRVRVGMTLGRMKVAKIGEKDVTFSIDEFGFSRQETLLLDMTSKTAGGAPGRRPQ